MPKLDGSTIPIEVLVLARMGVNHDEAGRTEQALDCYMESVSVLLEEGDSTPEQRRDISMLLARAEYLREELGDMGA